MPLTLSGPLYKWQYLGHSRLYSSLTLPFRDVVRLMRVRPFDATTQKGEQRDQADTHVRVLGKVVEGGEYTPTGWAANVPDPLQDRVEIYDQGGVEWFRLDVPEDAPLAQTDGGHRRESLSLLLQRAKDDLERAEKKGDQDAAFLARQRICDIEALPITVMVYLDGDAKLDFTRLQKSRPVDSTLLYSLHVAASQFDDDGYLLALDVARALHDDKRSPFYGVVRFDCKKRGRKGLEIPLKTLVASGSSDQATSLRGLVEVGRFFDLTTAEMAYCVVASYKAVADHRPELLQPGMLLTPVSAGGKRGQATMWTGLAVCLAYRGRGKPPSPDSLRRLADCAWSTLRDPVGGSFSSGRKRHLMGEFASAYLTDHDGEMWDGVPLELVQLVGAGAYGLAKLKR